MHATCNKDAYSLLTPIMLSMDKYYGENSVDPDKLASEAS